MISWISQGCVIIYFRHYSFDPSVFPLSANVNVLQLVPKNFQLDLSNYKSFLVFCCDAVFQGHLI